MHTYYIHTSSFTGTTEATLKVPFGFRPSAKSQLSKHTLDSLTTGQQRDMFHCFTQCLHNPCCQAVNITNCEQSTLRADEGMDFVKMVNIPIYFVAIAVAEYSS